MNNQMLILAITPEEVINKLLPNIWVFIAHVIATILLLIILSLFIYKPFKELMRKRRQVIKDLIEDAVSKQTQATKYETQANTLLKESKVQSEQILSDAKIEALNQRQEIINQANSEARLIDEQNKRDLLKERVNAQENIRKEIVEVAFNVAQSILQKEIDKKTNEILIDDFIKEIE